MLPPALRSHRDHTSIPLGPNGAESRARFRGITERLATAWQTPAWDEDKACRPAVLRNARNPETATVLKTLASSAVRAFQRTRSAQSTRSPGTRRRHRAARVEDAPHSLRAGVLATRARSSRMRASEPVIDTFARTIEWAVAKSLVTRQLPGARPAGA
jgi:hypothetical protein